MLKKDGTTEYRQGMDRMIEDCGLVGFYGCIAQEIAQSMRTESAQSDNKKAVHGASAQQEEET